MGLNLLASNQIYTYIIIGVVVVLLVGWLFLSNRKNKRRQNEYIEQLNAIAPGNKVKTAGGICGIVVEVCDDNTVIIETGSEQSGKSYIKMDKELIAQTDAKGPSQLAREEAEARRKAEKAEKEAGKAEEIETKEEAPEAEEAPAPVEEPVEGPVVTEVPQEEAPAAEVPAAEEAPKPKKSTKSTKKK